MVIHVSPSWSSFLPASSDSWRARASCLSSPAADTGRSRDGAPCSAPRPVSTVQKLSVKVKYV